MKKRVVTRSLALWRWPLPLATAFSPPASSKAKDPVAASGQLLRTNGAPASDVEISLTAQVERADGFLVPVVVGTDVTDASGNWAISLDRTVPGRVEVMELQTVIDGARQFYDYEPVPAGAQASAGAAARKPAKYKRLKRVRVVLKAGKGAVKSSVESGSSAPAGTDVSMSAPRGAAAPAKKAGGPQDAPDVQALPTAPSNTRVVGSRSAQTAPIGWYPLNEYKKVWVPLKSSRTLGKSVLEYHWSTSESTELGVAIEGSRGWYSGGLQRSAHDDTRTGLSPDWPNNTSKLVWAQWRYRKYQAYTFGGPPPSDPPELLDEYKWAPYEPIGFTRDTFNKPRFKCRNKGTVTSKVILDKTASVTWRGWFKLAGVPLSNTQTQTTSTSLVIDPDEGKIPKYCASGATLARSSFVRKIR